MNISIQHFLEKGIKKLEQYEKKFLNNPTDIASFVFGITDELHKLGLEIIKENFEFIDSEIQKDSKRKENWSVERHDMKCLTTSLGDVHFSKTYYKNKTTGEYEYLLDRMLEIDSHERMTEDAEAKMLEEVVQSSYKKAGEETSLQSSVSKQTVKNKIHNLEFPKYNVERDKKVVEYLYIDADEDHVSLQYINEKGDIKKPRTNTIMPKLIYVYEGITNENGRNELINKRHFGGVYEGGKEIEQLWKEVWDYIEASYDINAIKKVYINGDGAAWIKSGQKLIPKGKFVLDRFHMHKYIIGATSHLKDSVEDARSELYRAVYKKQKKDAEKVFEKILGVTEGEGKQKTVEAAKTYILENWAGIMQWVKDKNKEIECSAEGHVSHILADRMSSRPLGWSKTGADKMSRLRIYERNGGSMLELVRFQKKELPLAAGCEEVIYSCEQMLAAERKNRKRLGTLADISIYSIPYPKIKKIANFKDHIYGL